jgi:hypothetical protein
MAVFAVFSGIARNGSTFITPMALHFFSFVIENQLNRIPNSACLFSFFETDEKGQTARFSEVDPHRNRPEVILKGHVLIMCGNDLQHDWPLLHTKLRQSSLALSRHPFTCC